MSSSRFASYEDIMDPRFMELNLELNKLHLKFRLQEHGALNKERFHWLEKLSFVPSFYASRLWEYPFAILVSELSHGLKVADIGCGNTPFTAYLADHVGSQNVTGFDPDLIEDDTLGSHSHFGAKKSFINSLGINFHRECITEMKAPDNSFDRVFCISVLEHIEDLSIKAQGIKEMVRILRPGGRLILTFDLGINNPLNTILNIIQYSGLIPYGELNLKFPKKRFVNYDNGSNVDVYGLVLEKSNESIFVDHDEKAEIPMYKAYDRYAQLASFYAIDYSSILAARDLKSRFGIIKVLIKSFFKRY